VVVDVADRPDDLVEARPAEGHRVEHRREKRPVRGDDEQPGLTEQLGLAFLDPLGDVQPPVAHRGDVLAVADSEPPETPFVERGRGGLLVVAAHRDDRGHAHLGELVQEPVELLQVAPADRAVMAPVEHDEAETLGVLVGERPSPPTDEGDVERWDGLAG
jgi:hypothetical protein